MSVLVNQKTLIISRLKKKTQGTSMEKSVIYELNMSIKKNVINIRRTKTVALRKNELYF